MSNNLVKEIPEFLNFIKYKFFIIFFSLFNNAYCNDLFILKNKSKITKNEKKIVNNFEWFLKIYIFKSLLLSWF